MIHFNIASCNKNIQYDFAFVDVRPYYDLYTSSEAEQKDIYVNFSDSSGSVVPTSIVVDNVLIFGRNQHWCEVLAEFIQQNFSTLNKVSRIITSSQFLAIPIKERRNNNMLYIVIYNSIKLDIKTISEISDHTSSKFMFKLPGVRWEKYGRGVIVKKSSECLLRALGVNLYNAISVGLIASLGYREFCVMNFDHIVKRTLVNQIMLDAFA